VKIGAAVASAKSDYRTITSMAWDQDPYGTEPNCVYVYLNSGLDGVEQIKDRVSCEFGKTSFDLKIHNLDGKNFRLVKSNLEEDIVPSECKAIIKKNRIKIKLMKVKADYGYKSWINLEAKGKRNEEVAKDPNGGIMDMMKQLYEDGDDKMKKLIGETMEKTNRERMLPPDQRGKDDKHGISNSDWEKDGW